MASDGAGGAVRVVVQRASLGMADVGVAGWRVVSGWRLGGAWHLGVLVVLQCKTCRIRV